MTLSDFASLSTAVSGIAVTISLIYLAIQTRQASKHTRALIQQGASARTTGIMISTEDTEKSIAWLKGNGAEPTEDAVHKLQFNLQCGLAINAVEDFYFQHKDGLLDEELFARNCETFRGLLSEPGVRAYWLGRRESIGKAAPGFAKFVDALCSEEASAFKYRV
jgi:hypothetical protein